jgi:hypothetical protein
VKPPARRNIHHLLKCNHGYSIGHRGVLSMALYRNLPRCSRG